MTLSCAESEGVLFVAQELLARNLLNRMNFVQGRFCEIYDRTNAAEFNIRRYCYDVSTEEEASSSSSSSECFPNCDCECENQKVTSYLIVDNDWDDDMVDLLVELEQETCETIRLLKELEAVSQIDCNPEESSSSSLPDSSSSSESSSSSMESSSSSLESSSSSSLPDSSSSSLPELPSTISIFSECPTFGFAEPLTLFLIPGINIYVTEAEYQEWSSSESSSSSSLSYSGPGMASGYSVILGLSNWEMYFDGVLYAQYLGNDPYDPYGSYLIETGLCAGDYVVVE